MHQVHVQVNASGYSLCFIKESHNTLTTFYIVFVKAIDLYMYCFVFWQGRDYEPVYVTHKYTKEEQRTLSSFESVDYLPPHSEIYKQWLKNQGPLGWGHSLKYSYVFYISQWFCLYCFF